MNKKKELRKLKLEYWSNLHFLDNPYGKIILILFIIIGVGYFRGFPEILYQMAFILLLFLILLSILIVSAFSSDKGIKLFILIEYLTLSLLIGYLLIYFLHRIIPEIAKEISLKNFYIGYIFLSIYGIYIGLFATMISLYPGSIFYDISDKILHEYIKKLREIGIQTEIYLRDNIKIEGMIIDIFSREIIGIEKDGKIAYIPYDEILAISFKNQSRDSSS